MAVELTNRPENFQEPAILLFFIPYIQFMAGFFILPVYEGSREGSLLAAISPCNRNFSS